MISNKSSFAGLNGKSVNARHARNSRARRTLWQLACVLLVAVGASFFFSRHASALNVTWDGGGATNNWSEAANWSGDAVPGTNDVAIFDGTSTKNATIDVNINVQGIQINSGYTNTVPGTGTITQSGSSTVTVGGSGYTQSGGTFTGGSGDIDINGNFALSGGTFTASSGTTFFGGQFASDLPGGTFNHNGGTVVFDGNISVDSRANPAVTLNNLIVNKPNGNVFTLGGTLIVTGTLTFTDGVFFSGGPIEARGAVNIGPNFDGGGGQLNITDPASPPTRTITFPAGTQLVNIMLNSSSTTIDTTGTGTLVWKNLTLQAGAIQQGNNVTFVFNGNSYNQSGGTLTGSSSPITFGSNFTQSNGTFTGGSGDIDINGNFNL
ncbi:MAG: hypothetical protein ABI923_03055, partial [bacterium]